MQKIAPLLRWLPLAVARAPATVHTKLLVAFLTIVGLLIAVGAVSLAELGRLNQRAEDFVKLQRKIAAYRQIEQNTTAQLYSVATAMLAPDPDVLDATLRQLHQFGYDLDRLKFVAQDEVEVLQRVRHGYDGFTTAVSEVIDLVRAGKVTEGRTAQIERVGPLAERLERLTNELVNRAEAEMLARIDESHDGYAASRRWVVAFAFGSIILALGLGYAISLSLIGPLRQMGERFDQLAAGDFTKQVLVPNRDEMGALASDLNHMSDELGRLYQRLAATAEVLQVISGSVADAQPVFDHIAASGSRLLHTDSLTINLVGSDGLLHLAAYSGDPVRGKAIAARFPMRLDSTSTALAINERRAVHFDNIMTDEGVPEITRQVVGQSGPRSFVATPMFWEDSGIGAIVATRDPADPFSDKEIAFLKTFADQAVIAIQNSRQFHEIQDKSWQLEAANRHKSEFLAAMSHELRTPLNAIIGFSEVLAEKMVGDVNDKQLEYLRDIHGSGHHLLSLINDILDLSKIEAGRMELDLVCFNLREVLDSAAMLVRERAARNGLTLSLDAAKGPEEWVADQRKIKQVVINLLSNAVKFTPAGGSVTLRARHLKDADRSAVEIAVIDDGVGIEPDQQALVFEEFRQASGDQLVKSEGTGLGLTLAKRFVEMHGGTMRLESAPGKGSTFAFTLPERIMEST
ncbi:ATP-binding protein [Variovorax sp. J22R115]|uniref:ATP-binding protein n=1 Tax=Variovorax sp. J22R115 TaxID=3053509 RepID=UPI002576533B|nr:ATP-binding protein [Variovorax sp. J22R115]MDM0050575.1 ATP-binding protein [Variovorax sp. J22R115]